MTQNNDFNNEPEDYLYESSGPFDKFFLLKTIREGYLFEKEVLRLENLVNEGSIDQEEANLALNKGRKNELRTALKEILKGGEELGYFIAVAVNYAEKGVISQKKVELVIEKGRKNYARNILNLVAEGTKGFTEELEKQVAEGLVSEEEVNSAKQKYLQVESKKALEYVREGYNSEYDNRLPILRTAVESGLLDQEDLNLAIFEGKKNAAIHVMEFVSAGIQLSQHIPKLLDAVRKGLIDQEEAFLAIAEGKGLRKLYDV